MNAQLTRHISLDGKAALITGAARGIGLESARLLAQAGAAVAICDIDAGGAERTAAELRAAGHSATAFGADVSAEESVREAVAGAVSAMGGLDILVNNAGILDAVPVPDLTAAMWDRMLSVNLRGCQFCSQAALPHLIRAGGGRIVNVASMAGQIGGLLAGVHYTAAKGGLIAMTKGYARYCARYGINVNCVAPGLMLTDMTRDRDNHPETVPLGRNGTALDAAKAVFFLSTALSDYITGATIDVNGGVSMR